MAPLVIAPTRGCIEERLAQRAGSAIGASGHRQCCGKPWHADSGVVADERGHWVCNTIWMLDDFTPENGATRMIPRSHTWGRLPERGLKDSLPGEELLFGRAGTVVIMNTHIWHGGTANRTDRCRSA